MLKLLFADSFRHTGPVQEQNTDYIKFSSPIIIRKWRIIRKGGATHQSLDHVGCTFPGSFKVELFVRDKNRQDTDKWERLGEPFQYDEHSTRSVYPPREIVTDHLLLRGRYSAVTLCVYGSRVLEGTALGAGNSGVVLSDQALTEHTVVSPSTSAPIPHMNGSNGSTADHVVGEPPSPMSTTASKNPPSGSNSLNSSMSAPTPTTTAGDDKKGGVGSVLVQQPIVVPPPLPLSPDDVLLMEKLMPTLFLNPTSSNTHQHVGVSSRLPSSKIPQSISDDDLVDTTITALKWILSVVLMGQKPGEQTEEEAQKESEKKLTAHSVLLVLENAASSFTAANGSKFCCVGGVELILQLIKQREVVFAPLLTPLLSILQKCVSGDERCLKLLSPLSHDLLHQTRARMISCYSDDEKEGNVGDGEDDDRPIVVQKERSPSVQSNVVGDSATRLPDHPHFDADVDGYSTLAELLISDRISTPKLGNALEGLINRIHLAIACEQLSTLDMETSNESFDSMEVSLKEILECLVSASVEISDQTSNAELPTHHQKRQMVNISHHHLIETQIADDVIRLLQTRQLVRLLILALTLSSASTHTRFHRAYLLVRGITLQLLRSKNGTLFFLEDSSPDLVVNFSRALCQTSEALSYDDVIQLRNSTLSLSTYLSQPVRCQPRNLAYLLTVHTRAVVEVQRVLLAAETNCSAEKQIALLNLSLLLQFECGKFAYTLSLSLFEAESVLLSFLTTEPTDVGSNRIFSSAANLLLTFLQSEDHIHLLKKEGSKMKEAVSSITSDQMLVSQIADALSPFGTYSQEGALGILVQLCSAAKSFSSDSEVLLLTKLSTLTTMKLLFYDSLMDVGVAVSLLNSAECFALIRTLLNEATAILSKPHKALDWPLVLTAVSVVADFFSQLVLLQYKFSGQTSDQRIESILSALIDVHFVLPLISVTEWFDPLLATMTSSQVDSTSVHPILPPLVHPTTLLAQKISDVISTAVAVCQKRNSLTKIIDSTMFGPLQFYKGTQLLANTLPEPLGQISSASSVYRNSSLDIVNLRSVWASHLEHEIDSLLQMISDLMITSSRSVFVHLIRIVTSAVDLSEKVAVKLIRTVLMHPLIDSLKDSNVDLNDDGLAVHRLMYVLMCVSRYGSGKAVLLSMHDELFRGVVSALLVRRPPPPPLPFLFATLYSLFERKFLEKNQVPKTEIIHCFDVIIRHQTSIALCPRDSEHLFLEDFPPLPFIANVSGLMIDLLMQKCRSSKGSLSEKGNEEISDDRPDEVLLLAALRLLSLMSSTEYGAKQLLSTLPQTSIEFLCLDWLSHLKQRLSMTSSLSGGTSSSSAFLLDLELTSETLQTLIGLSQQNSLRKSLPSNLTTEILPNLTTCISAEFQVDEPALVQQIRDRISLFEENLNSALKEETTSGAAAAAAAAAAADSSSSSEMRSLAERFEISERLQRSVEMNTPHPVPLWLDAELLLPAQYFDNSISLDHPIFSDDVITTNELSAPPSTTSSAAAKTARIESRTQSGQRKDVFRSRKTNTSRPPSMHVDDFMKGKKAGTPAPAAAASSASASSSTSTSLPSEKDSKSGTKTSTSSSSSTSASAFKRPRQRSPGRSSSRSGSGSSDLSHLYKRDHPDRRAGSSSISNERDRYSDRSGRSRQWEDDRSRYYSDAIGTDPYDLLPPPPPPPLPGYLMEALPYDDYDPYDLPPPPPPGWIDPGAISPPPYFPPPWSPYDHGGGGYYP